MRRADWLCLAVVCAMLLAIGWVLNSRLSMLYDRVDQWQGIVEQILKQPTVMDVPLIDPNI